MMRKNNGYLFWITGLSGSGKTSLAEKIYEFVKKNYGTTLILSGDNLRRLFNFNKFDKRSRLEYAFSYSKFCKQITDQNINIIFSTISMYHKIRSWNKKNIKNYIEIYIEADIQKLIKIKKKPFYRKKIINIVGKDIEAELPKNPDIKIINNFVKSVNQLKLELIKKIKLKI
jgi:adenylylsulfate kinase